jgi:fructuronate reductase
MEKKVTASVMESLKASPDFAGDWERLKEIFRAPSLQMVSFTITEKGYGVSPADLERGLAPSLIMGKVTALLLERFLAGGHPLTLQSMDNCSHNGGEKRKSFAAWQSLCMKSTAATTWTWWTGSAEPGKRRE